MDAITIPPVKVRLNVLYDKINYECGESTLFSASPYGGPIVFGKYVPATVSSWELTIRTCSGIKLSSIKVEMRDLHALYWTRNQRLVVLSKRGHVFVYTPLGKRVLAHHFGQEAKVIQSRFFNSSHGNSGLAVLLETNFIFVVSSVMDFAVWRLPQLEHREAPSAWNVLSPATFGQVTVVSVIKNNFYLGVQGFPSQVLNVSWKLSEGKYLDACPNWDSSLIAFSHASGVVQIANSDFLLLYSVTLPDSLPSAAISGSSFSSGLFWFGSQAIAVKVSRNSLLASSMESKQYEFFFDGDIRLEVEPDGVKAFTEKAVSLISLVPEEVDNVIGLLSQHCGADLYAASEKYDGKSVGAYHYITTIGDQIDKAVQACLFAAAHQFDCSLQQKLLKAAHFGKSLAPHDDSSQFADTCKVLRVLNNIRLPFVGIPMSFAQSTELKMASLIDRLIDLGHWLLAIRLCEYMNVEPKTGVHRVLAHWAASKIEDAKLKKSRGAIPNYAELADLIVSKFSSFPDAVEAELNDLAVLLLEKETHLDRRVQMLLSLNKHDLALRTATKSQQPDLLHLAVKHLKQTLRKDEVDRLLPKYPQALVLYQEYLRETAPKHALALYKQYDDFARQAICYLEEAESTPFNPFEMKQKTEGLSKAKQCVTNLKETSAEQLLEEALELMQLCESLDSKSNFANVDRNKVRAVYIWAAGQKEENQTLLELMKKKFKLTDKQICMWKIEGFAQYGKWYHLESLLKNKKPPVGYMPFIEACIRYGNHEFGEQLVEKLSSPEEVVEAHLMLGAPEKAALHAVENNLTEYIDMLRSRYRSGEDHNAEVLRILSEYRKF